MCRSWSCGPTSDISPTQETPSFSSGRVTLENCAMTWPLNCIRRREPLANHTSFRIGGPAEWFAQPSSLEELAEVLREASRAGLPVSILGGGTNTLVADRGMRGLVVHLGGEFRTLPIQN